jgi:acetyl esterase/lipase
VVIWIHGGGWRAGDKSSLASGDTDCVVPLQHSRDLHDALIKAGAAATLTVLPGAGQEDPAFMRTQSAPTLAFLDRTLRQR